VIWDNGRGGARLVGQPELTAIADRVRIFGGTSTLDSPPGGPTRLALELPVDPMWV
jgi:signal transduction histidine kinase